MMTVVYVVEAVIGVFAIYFMYKWYQSEKRKAKKIMDTDEK